MNASQKEQNSKRLLGNLLLILTAMIWGCAFVAQRSGMEHIEPLTFNAARLVLASAAVGTLALVTGRRRAAAQPDRTPEQVREERRATVFGGICCGCFMAASSALQQMGLVYTEAGKAGFITALYMLLVPVLSFVLFRKKHSVQVWIAVAIGLVGLYLLCMAESLRLNRGDALICLGALTYSGHILCTAHFVQKGNPVGIAALQFMTAAAITLPLAFLTEEPTWAKVASAAVPILYCGLASSGIGHTLQIVAQKFTEPTVASLLMSLESVFAVLAGALILGERMSSRELLGCVIMFAAIVLVQIPLPKKKHA